MTIERYMVEYAGGEAGPFEDIEEARNFAMEVHGKLIAHIFEWNDSELMEDHSREDDVA